MVSKETKKWLRALGIAKILFEEQGYHSLYLEGIEGFIWRKAMYSPKIREDLIPKIYGIEKDKLEQLMRTVLLRIIQRPLKSFSWESDSYSSYPMAQTN